LYDSGGYNPAMSVHKMEYEHPTFQVKVRDSSYPAGYARCEAIKDALNGNKEQTINGHRYLIIRQMGDIISLGRDIKNRSEFSLNFECKVIRRNE
jgi:hypothetical protein